VFWLAAWWGKHPWLAGVVREELLGHDQFVVAGNPQVVLFTGVQYDDFLLVAKQFRAGDTSFRHVSCVLPVLKSHKMVQ
jgi:hypothetical protein